MSQSYMTFPHFIFFSICRKLFGWYVRVCVHQGGREGRRGERVCKRGRAHGSRHKVWVFMQSLQSAVGAARQPPLPGAVLCADLI